MPNSKQYSVLAASAFFALGIGMSLGGTGALADTGVAGAPSAQFAQCGKLPLSEREICTTRAQAEAAHAAPQPALTPSSGAMLTSSEMKYHNDLAACAKLPLSEREICQANAQAQRSESLGQATATNQEQIQLQHEAQLYQMTTAPCASLPLSERDACVSKAGIQAKSAGG